MRSSPEVRASIRGADDIDAGFRAITGGVDDAASQHAAARLEGFREGRHEGLELGLLEGRSLGQEATASALGALSSVIDELRQRDDRDLAQLEHLAVDLAFELAQAILERELAITADPGADVIRRALALRAGRETVRVRLHPDDAALVDASPHTDVEVVIDPSLPRGGAAAELGDGFADLSIEAALERVRKALS
jgi:flagellar biosynthesis/type III secretory pathway protein FliH